MIKRAQEKQDPIAEDVIWSIFTQVAIGLNECHNHKKGKILHRDLKPQNIFVTESHQIKIGDFGLSKQLDQNDDGTLTNVGTPYYMSPELVDQIEYNDKSDVWSLGAIVYELCMLEPLFKSDGIFQLSRKIKEGKTQRISATFSDELDRVINLMLEVRHEKRPSINELLKTVP